ncbi:MAG TPA: isoprenylcysteine carboxylmethyltransferase family protein [Ilumatobacteraceae bacterium]|nr:isoprenylcysteine carboxylmethyltransferase family protein [Ilumatobacteraceae bacterium]
MSRSAVGWAWVAGQVVLLVALVVVPGRDDWPTPAWLRLVAQVVFVTGIAVLIVASLRLGRALTPTPVPTSSGQLQTGGLYRYVRHPIYSGVLLIVVGITLRSGSFAVLALAVATVVFFDRKARWEEARLAERYPGYAEYAARTPRFVPRPR